ncbi:hypothetical protein GCM10028791_16840 [Echinicola sediminis]
MTVSKTELPQNSVLAGILYDYTDSFEGELADPDQVITSTDIGRAFFTSSPKWVDKLFALRNGIVRMFGLKTSGGQANRQQEVDEFKCEVGEQLGLFKVFSKSQNEVVLGENDKHLDFRVSLFWEPVVTDHQKKRLIISTAVKFNNSFGRLYFLPVRSLP